MYKVIAYFIDLKDENHEYRVGDTFPRKGLEVNADRLAELSGKENKRGIPLIEKVEDAPAGDHKEDAPAGDHKEDAPAESDGKKPAKKKPAGK